MAQCSRRVIPIEWSETLGAGVRVFILDTGLISGTPVCPVQQKSFTSDRSMADPSGHGTRMAQIVASRDPLDLGVAPACELYIAKVIGPDASWAPVLAALDWALEERADVIGMSWATAARLSELEARVDLLDRGGAITVAAHRSGLPYPHSYPSVVSVGALGVAGDADLSTVWEVVKRFAGQPRLCRGTSVATAVMAGVAACAKAYDPGTGRPDFLRCLREEIP